jgi:hypothetical protein
MANITLLPSAKVPLVYEGENTMTTEWYRFFWNIYGFTAAGTIPVSKGGTGLSTIGDHQIIIGNANNVFEPVDLSSSTLAITYPAGYVNLDLNASGVTPGAYGSASQVGTFTVNQYGILTTASTTSIAIDANQITSGTIASARISGSYTGITGVGTLTVGTWNATTIGVPYGGTGITSLTANYIPYGNGTSAFNSSANLTFDGTTLAAPLLKTTGYTVATLPAAGVAGRRAHVTDALAPVFLGALTGGGAVKCPVFDNGTAWVAG